VVQNLKTASLKNRETYKKQVQLNTESSITTGRSPFEWRCAPLRAYLSSCLPPEPSRPRGLRRGEEHDVFALSPVGVDDSASWAGPTVAVVLLFYFSIVRFF
jgi:hypothetical protein